MIGRREFIAGLSGAVIWPLTARAQQPGMPMIGFLDPLLLAPNSPSLNAFRRGLAEAGYVDGLEGAFFPNVEGTDARPGGVVTIIGDELRFKGPNFENVLRRVSK
jgi:hypothetical protein